MVPREFGRFLDDGETYRRRLDYGSGGVERAPDELIEETSSFLDAMREVVDTNVD